MTAQQQKLGYHCIGTANRVHQTGGISAATALSFKLIRASSTSKHLETGVKTNSPRR